MLKHDILVTYVYITKIQYMYLQMDGSIHDGSVNISYEIQDSVIIIHVLLKAVIDGIHGSNYLGKTKGNGSKLFLGISLWEVLIVLKRTGVLCFVVVLWTFISSYERIFLCLLLLVLVKACQDFALI